MSNTELICHFCGGGIARPQENWGHWWDSPTCLSCYLELSAMSDHEQAAGMDIDSPYRPNEPTDGGQLEMTALLTAEAAKGETR